MRNKLLAGVIILALLIAGIFFFYMNRESAPQAKGEIVFIDSFEVFEEFTMKKEYDKMLEQEISADRAVLDSLGESLNNMITTKKAGEAEINLKKTEYFRYKESYEKAFRELSGKYTEQVYERLNGYIKDFGKKQQYRLILGANGQGNVMYVDKNADITESLILYINQQYLDN